MEDQATTRNNAELVKQLDFVLQKFLLKTAVLEEEQKLLGKEMEELLRMMRLKKVYQHIVTKH